jgi:hypothetical protein
LCVNDMNDDANSANAEELAFSHWRQRLEIRVGEWQRSGARAGELLRGAAIAEALRWIALRPVDFSELQRRYIESSLQHADDTRQQSIRRRTAAIGVFTVAIALLAAAVWFLWEQWRSAEQARQQMRQTLEHAQQAQAAATRKQEESGVSASKARELATGFLGVLASSIFDKAPSAALLLATESLNIDENRDGERVLRMLLGQPTGMPLKGSGESTPVTAIAISREGTWLVSADLAGAVRVWDRTRPETAPLQFTGSVKAIAGVAISADGRRVIAGGSEGDVVVWDREHPGVEPAVWHADGLLAGGIAVSDNGRWVAAATKEGRGLRSRTAGKACAELVRAGTADLPSCTERRRQLDHHRRTGWHGGGAHKEQ